MQGFRRFRRKRSDVGGSRHYQSADTFCACLFNQSGSNQRFSPSGRFGRFGAEFPESVCGQLLFIGGIQLIERPRRAVGVMSISEIQYLHLRTVQKKAEDFFHKRRGGPA